MKKLYGLTGLAFFVSMLLVQAIIAQTSASQNNSALNEVEVGIYVLNLGKFDIATGSFTVDFYLSLKCSKSCNKQDFEFVNGRATSIDKIIDSDKEKFYRIQAQLASPIDLKKFPFDQQKIQIVLEDKKNTLDYLVYVPNDKETGIDESIAFAGWNIEPWYSSIREHEYPVYNEVYSQYVLTIPISRVLINSIIKTFLPISFIILVMLSSFVLDPDKITTRLAMVGSALVASVMFHVSLANQVPPVSYLTFADKFMILSYFVILLSFVLNVSLLELHERKQEDLVKKIHRWTEFTMFIVVPLAYALLFMFGV